MRFNINLASQPYQDVHRFVVRWGLALMAVALLSAGLVYAATSALMSWRVTAREAKYLRQQIAERNQQKAQVEAFLNRAENRDTRDRSQFVNLLIARKAFSWTEVFSDLEEVVPRRLHVTTIKPEVTDDGQLQVRLTVAGPARDEAVELVRRLEASPHFSDAQVLSEQQTQEGNTEIVRFDISAIYIPSFARTPEQPKKSAEKAAAQPQTEARNVGH
ncbi:MAG: PilN domain-containing protein [Terriglobales bacterium]